MYKIIFGVLAGGALLGMASCEKVIDLKLGDSSSQVVIEGQIVDNAGGTIKLSKSVQFGDPNSFPPITGALVTITDVTINLTDTLRENPGGMYYYQYVGNEGHAYNLTVVTPNDGTFTATSTMPQKVSFDSLYLETATIFGQKGGQLYPVYTDPAGIANFYRFQVYIQGRLEAGSTRDDRLSDGRINGQPIGFGIEDSIKSGAPIVVDMQCIDEPTYRYFSTQGRSDGNSAAPANPINNITGGALGYFSAHTVSQKTIVLP